MLRSPALPALALTLSALIDLALPASAAAQAGQPDPGFSILAPQAGRTDPTPDQPVADLSDETYIVIGPHLDRDSYLALRGGTHDQVLRTRWRIARTALDGTALDSEQREIVIGDGYVTETGESERVIQDFLTRRTLTRVPALDGPVMRNEPFVAHIHRQMNTFAYYTEGGTLDQVTGPGGTAFDRFWIEAAMGVRLAEAELASTVNEDGITEIRRNADGSALFTHRDDRLGAGRPAALFRAWLQHSVPVHPDALATLVDEAGIPAEFSFLVFSPSSPDGRRETWTRLSEHEDAAAFPWPEGLAPARADSYQIDDPAVRGLLQAGLDAAARPSAAPADADFLAAADAAQRRADPAGAYLALYQISHHQGPCRGDTPSPVCNRMSQVTASGIGNANFEALMSAITSMQSDRAAAITILRDHLHRDGLEGGAANLLAAQALAALRSSQAGALPDMNLPALFAASAVADPYAPMAFWHGGRFVASQGDVETAWLLFDIARSLPASQSLPPAREAVAMSEQLQMLAPGFFLHVSDTPQDDPDQDADEGNAVDPVEN
ncbi:hypothetical protein AWH62_02175 [Maricaulis sp. W15]|uniref:Uncharacterized protein n=1 Tax=Maricaulis maris TaxID=74318 RepID=A0A495DLV2_9PROT|nr:MULTISPECIES: hypothetical protein [Maricaulis]OLF81499.1 hypothetical protein AWH62_02175 [Maricaulis sp. W15]RKR03903.1 hypothetical protein C7435_0346 [Maricaulis maris]